jgi:hypothetical protein
MKAKFTEADLVSFGNYLLSDKRNNRIERKEAKNYVGDWDVSNWIEIMSNGDKRKTLLSSKETRYGGCKRGQRA